MILPGDIIESQIRDRKLFLIGDFDDDMLTNFCMAQSKGIKPGTELWMHSPGGGIYTFWALRDLVSINNNIEKIIGFGIVYSAAAMFFLTLPSYKQKYMTKNSSMMFHQVRWPVQVQYESEMKSTYTALKEDNGQIISIIEKAVTDPKKRKNIITRFKGGEDIYLKASECLELGLINGIIDCVNDGGDGT